MWCPWYDASRITSLHHTIITEITNSNPIVAIKPPYWYEWKYIALPDVKPNNPIDPTYGQGLGSTKWYG